MRAIIMKRGRVIDIYALENNGSIEIKDFFDYGRNYPDKKCIVSGFNKYINFIADNGHFNLSDKIFKCWKRKRRDQICEIRKGQDRISCFFHADNKLLLATYFIKTRAKEEEEYSRAINLNKRFLENPIWEG